LSLVKTAYSPTGLEFGKSAEDGGNCLVAPTEVLFKFVTGKADRVGHKQPRRNEADRAST